MTRLGRHAEQPVYAETLTAFGMMPDFAYRLRGIARVAPLDEETLARVVSWVDFRRAEKEDT